MQRLYIGASLLACLVAGETLLEESSRRRLQTVIGFEGFSAGDFVGDLGNGVTVTARPRNGSTGGCFGPGDNQAMVFDSSNPSFMRGYFGSPHWRCRGGGPGWGQGGAPGAAGENCEMLGNLLIVSGNCDQENPTENPRGGVIGLSFAQPKTVGSIGFLSVVGGVYIDVSLAGGGSFRSDFIQGVGNGGFLNIDLGLENVVDLEVTFLGRGSIAYVSMATSRTIAPTAAMPEPTVEPGIEPTADPGIEPTADPGIEPTADPGIEPTADPGIEPTADPGIEPTTEPAIEPTTGPSEGTTVASYDFVDTFIWEAMPDTSYGDTDSITVDQEDSGFPTMGLIKETTLLGSIPAGATIHCARLTLYTNNPTGGTVSAYRMATSWDGSSTWNSFGSDGVTVGTDASSTTSFTIETPPDETFETRDVTDDVIAWLAGDANEGWVFINDSGDGWDFWSSDYTGFLGRRPRLAITYTVGGGGDVACPDFTFPPTTSPTQNPTVAGPMSPTVVFTDIVDTFIWAANPDTSYGDADDIGVDQDDDGFPTMALVKVPSLLDSIPPGATIESATLTFYTNSASDGTVSAYRMTSAWSESSTWNDFGGDGVTLGSEASGIVSFAIVAPVDESFVANDVTADVEFWFEGGVNEGWVLINDSGDGWDFWSAEFADATLRPQLEVAYFIPTTTITSNSLIDTYIWLAEPDSSFGNATDISVDNEDGGFPTMALVKEPALLADVPADATIESATLTFYTNSFSPGPVSGYRMTSAWSESSTWNDFGADGVTPGSEEAVGTASFVMQDLTDESFVTVTVTDDVISWLNGDDNEGWVLINESDDGWDFDSAEVSSADNRPRLEISYSVGAPAPPPPPSVTFTDLVDTYVWQAEPDATFGEIVDITVDESDGGFPTRALIKEPTLLGSLPPGAVLDTATLTFYTNSASGGTVTAHRMLSSWNESSSWNDFVYEGLTPGVDAELTPSFRLVEPESDVFETRTVTDDVAFWLDGGLNEGWLLINDSGDGWDFWSSEFSDVELRPKLVLTYFIPSTTIQFSELVDTYIWEATPDTAYGDVDDISVDQDDDGFPTVALVKEASLLSSLPDGVTIDSATLTFYTNGGSDGTITAYRMTAGWSEASTWNSFGSDGVTLGLETVSTVSFTIVAPPEESFVTVDVTDDLAAWLEGDTNEGWVLVNDSGDGWDFWSSE